MDDKKTLLSLRVKLAAKEELVKMAKNHHTQKTVTGLIREAVYEKYQISL